VAAASTAATASPAVAAGARVAIWPSNGFARSNVALPVAAFGSPSISIEIVFMSSSPGSCLLVHVSVLDLDFNQSWSLG
jgi:hypothetical protein